METPGKHDGRLAAVWVADVVGFTALSSRDHTAALRQLETFQRVSRSAVEDAGGRLIKFVGDGALAEFGSADAAVRAGAALQRTFVEAAEPGIPYRLRIGINIGEVVSTADGDLHGDGIRVASRLQEEAAPDEILVSEDVHRQLRSRREFYFEAAGERLLRGIEEPVGTFTVRPRRADDADRTSLAGRIGAHLRSRRARVMVSVVGVYFAALWTAVEIAAFAEERYQLTSNVTDVVFASLLLLLPSVLLVTYYHADPGKQKVPLPEKVGIPANLIAASIIVVLMFGTEDIGAVMQTVTVTDSEGQVLERQIPRAQYRQRIAVFPFDAPDDGWHAHGFAYAIQMKLSQDMFFNVQTPADFSARLKRTAFPDGIGMPVSLQREIARERHLGHFLSGRVSREDGGGLLAKVSVHDSARGRNIAQSDFSAPDLFTLTDAIADWLKGVLGIPEWHLESVGDLPTAEVLTASLDAYEAYAAGATAVALQNDFEAGVAHFKRAVELDPSFAVAHLTLGSVYLMSNQTQGALTAFTAATEHAYRLPERIQILLNHNYYYVSQEIERSYAVLDMGAELYPDDIFLLSLKAQIDMLRDDRESAIALLLRIIELDPEQQQMLHVVARLTESLGREEDAHRYLVQYTERFPEDHDGYLKTGEFLARVGRHDEAAIAFQRAALLKPDDIAIVIQLATVERNLGDFDGAWKLLDDALSMAATPEEREQVFSARRDLFRFRGQNVLALQALQAQLAEVAKFQPPLMALMAQLNSAGMYVNAGQPEAGQAIIERVVAQLQPPLDSIAAVGRLQFALAQEDPELIAAAVPAFDAVIENFSLHAFRAQSVYARGFIHELRGECAQAIPYYEEEATLSPTDKSVNHQLGRCYHALGDHARALPQLREALRVMPMAPKVHYSMAMLLKDMGDREAARRHLDIALSVWAEADGFYEPARKAREAAASL